MKGHSVIRPEEFVAFDGGYQFRFNIAETVVDGATTYEYDFVNVAACERPVLIDALITHRYSYSSQLGKLALSRTSNEWKEYDAYRQSCYSVVDEALQRRCNETVC